MTKQSVLTVSVGKTYYHRLTINLIKSFLLHNKSDIRLNVLTDNIDFFSEFRGHDLVVLQDINIAQQDKSFTSKFYMYDKAIAEENLFIDCDCLIYQDLSQVFKAFEGRNFSAIGSMQTKGDFFCDIASIISRFNISSIPVFVGSVYYFKKNKIVGDIFKKAIELKKNYDNLGFIRLRNKENEEPLIAIAMALHGETCLNSTSLKADAMFYREIDANVIKGTNNLIALSIDSKAKDIYANISVKNIPIIHFNASFSDGWHYTLESFRLKRHQSYGIFVDLIGYMAFKYPSQIVSLFKDTFRPLYRKILGTRSIKKSNRL